MSSSFGERVKITIFGQSHSEGLGVVIDGLPAGESIDMEEVQRFMQRRAPGRHAYQTPRKEADVPRVLSGLFEGKTCGAPLCAVIENTNTRSADYEKLKVTPRPAHADFTAEMKYDGFQDYRGGGHFSGRLTAPLCFAGAVCMQILARRGILIGGHILSVGDVADSAFSLTDINAEILAGIVQKVFPVCDDAAGVCMREKIDYVREEHDSIGGVIEAAAIGLPVGIGEPMFDGLESRLALILFAIPAVKGVEFGNGFEAAQKYGSENNDAFVLDSTGEIRTKTNNHGGILGGISSGMPLILRTAFKPTPSIGKTQSTVNLQNCKEEALEVGGRHDPCIVPRAVPCVEAAMAVAILDLLCISQINE